MTFFSPLISVDFFSAFTVNDVDDDDVDWMILISNADGKKPEEREREREREWEKMMKNDIWLDLCENEDRNEFLDHK